MYSCQGDSAFILRRSAFAAIAAFILALGLGAHAQTLPGQQEPVGQNEHAAQPAKSPPAQPISEEDIRRQFQGKTVYLRGGYLDNDLHFDEKGRLAGSSPQASYTLSLVQIDKVHVSKRKVQIEGVRFGLHFLGAGPTEDPLSASDKVRITPRKKILRITIQRAAVVKPKVVKPKKEKRSKDKLPSPMPGSPSAPALESSEPSMLTQARANQMLTDALDRIFSPGLDDKMIASMPDFWQLFYKAAAAKSNYKPDNSSVLRQNAVDQKARLITIFEPASNDFAQNAGVAGVALYHVVVGPDGKPADIAVGRPIGFGLDENAVASIRKASFQPAMKDSKPVPVLLDLFVQFRIYSKRTGAAANEAASATLSEPETPSLPGPYSANQPTNQP